jgi:hypothetical protein
VADEKKPGKSRDDRENGEGEGEELRENEQKIFEKEVASKRSVRIFCNLCTQEVKF